MTDETNTDTSSSTTKEEDFLRIILLNIVSGRNNRLEMAARSLQKMGADIGILTETKITDERYTRRAFGYNIVATQASSSSCGGVAILVKEGCKNWHVEGTQPYGANVINTVIVSGSDRWNLIGSYIAPSETNGETIAEISKAANRNSHKIIWVGDLNVDLENVRDDRQAEIAALVASMGTIDLTRHFKQKKKWTWNMRRSGQVISSVTDYFMAERRDEWKNVTIRYPDGFITDHRAVRGDLWLRKKGQHAGYVNGRKRYPLPLKASGSRVDRLFEELRQAREKTASLPPYRDKSWISKETWRLIDLRANDRRNNRLAGIALCEANRTIKKAIRRDKREYIRRTGEEAENCLANFDILGAYSIVRRWYRKTTGQPPKPTWEDLKSVKEKYAKLFTAQETFPEENLAVEVQPRFPIPDNIPEAQEIEKILLGMKRGKSPGPSKMRVEDLRRWLKMSKDAEDPRPELWSKVVEIVQEAFRTGELPAMMTNALLVLIPKADVTQFRGIGLLEVLWKLISAMIHKRIVENVSFHDGIHGFRTRRGTGTAILEAKLLMQKAACTNKTLYQVFLDLTKAYDTVDRERVLEILEQYGIGPNIIRLLRRYWSNNTLVPKQSGFFGEPFAAERGVTQGDIISPTIFNIIVDAVLRIWYAKMNLVVNDAVLPETSAIFYADDGKIAGENHARVQEGLSLITDLFARMGLNMSQAKTKSVITTGDLQYHSIAEVAYKRRMVGGEESYRKRKSRKISCPTCEMVIAESHLKTHLLHQHGTVQEIQAQNIIEMGSYTVSMPHRRMKVTCPVPGCPGGAAERYGLRRHFMYRHPNDTIVIQEEGVLQRCERCYMFVTTKHASDNETCRQGTEQKKKREMDAGREEERNVKFHINGSEVENVTEFKYLGRWLSQDDNDLKAVRANIQKARQRWGTFSRVLTREGADTKMVAQFYLTIVQSVLLYGAETWCLTQRQMSLLSSFHNRCARSLTKRWIRRKEDGTWDCPGMAETFRVSGLVPIQQYISKRKAALLPHARSRAIYRKCLRTSRSPSAAHKVVWWE